MLIEAIRPAPANEDIDVVIGVARPARLTGLVQRARRADGRVHADLLVRHRGVPGGDPEARRHGGEGVQDRRRRSSSAASSSSPTTPARRDEHRALNYLAVRYPAIYAHATERFATNATLTSVDVQPSRLSGIRTLVNVIFTFTDRATGVPESPPCASTSARSSRSSPPTCAVLRPVSVGLHRLCASTHASPTRPDDRSTETIWHCQDSRAARADDRRPSGVR